MKKLFVIPALLVSILTFGQETSGSWIGDFEKFNVDIPNGKKFKYLDPKTYKIYHNTALGYSGSSNEVEDTANVMAAIGLTKQQACKFYKELENKHVQVVTGFYWFSFDKKYLDEAIKIVESCSSTQELKNKMKKIDDPMESIDNFNTDFKEDVYYTISGFYYTIEKLNNGEYQLEVIFPIGKERTLKK